MTSGPIINTLFVLIGLFIAEISCQCSLETSLVYQEIAEDNYDSNWYPISDPGDRHPLGFYRNLTVYNEDEKNPCISLDDVTDRHVEVMFEVIPKVSLCFRVNGGDKICENAGRHQACQTPKATSTNLYEFFADAGEGASESDITFWYRLVRGPIRAEDTEDEWCMNRQNAFPGDLLPLSPNRPIPTDEPSDDNSATKTSLIAPLLFLSLLFHFLK